MNLYPAFWSPLVHAEFAIVDYFYLIVQCGYPVHLHLLETDEWWPDQEDLISK